MHMNAEDAYQLGLKAGREEAIAEIWRLLKLDERIAEAIRQHENIYHDAD
jgi:hypothetical protein